MSRRVNWQLPASSDGQNRLCFSFGPGGAATDLTAHVQCTYRAPRQSQIVDTRSKNHLEPFVRGQPQRRLVLRRPGQQGYAQGSSSSRGTLRAAQRNHGAPAAHARNFGTTPPAPGQRPPRANLSVQSTTPAFINGRRAGFTVVLDKEGTGCLVARPAVAFADLHRPPRAERCLRRGL